MSETLRDQLEKNFDEITTADAPVEPEAEQPSEPKVESASPVEAEKPSPADPDKPGRTFGRQRDDK